MLYTSSLVYCRFNQLKWRTSAILALPDFALPNCARATVCTTWCFKVTVIIILFRVVCLLLVVCIKPCNGLCIQLRFVWSVHCPLRSETTSVTCVRVWTASGIRTESASANHAVTERVLTKHGCKPFCSTNCNNIKKVRALIVLSVRNPPTLPQSSF